MMRPRYDPSFFYRRDEEESSEGETEEEQGGSTLLASILSNLNDAGTMTGPFLGPKMSKAATGVSVANAGADPTLANGLDAAISLGSKFLGPVGTAHTALSAASTTANMGVRGLNKLQGLEGEDAFKEFRSPSQFMLDQLPKIGGMMTSGMQQMEESGMPFFDVNRL